jgi:hypothetical protein
MQSCYNFYTIFLYFVTIFLGKKALEKLSDLYLRTQKLEFSTDCFLMIVYGLQSYLYNYIKFYALASA